MEGFILAFAGPYTNWVLGLSFGLVFVMRSRIRKRHIVTLVVITILAFVAFFGVLLAGLAGGNRGWQVSPAVFQVTLKVLAFIVIGCGPAVGFFFILKSLGLVSRKE